MSTEQKLSQIQMQKYIQLWIKGIDSHKHGQFIYKLKVI